MFQFSLTVASCGIILIALLIGYQYIAQKLGFDLGGKQNSAQQPQINLSAFADYRRVYEPLAHCIRENCHKFKLDTVDNSAKHFLGQQDAFYGENGQQFFVYRFRHRLDGVGILNGHGRYDTTPAMDIADMINGAIFPYCMEHNTVPLAIYNAIDDEDGWIRFYVGYANV